MKQRTETILPIFIFLKIIIVKTIEARKSMMTSLDKSSLL